MEPIIQVTNLSKNFYIINNQRSRVKSLFKGGRSNEVKHALRNVSFEIYPGDVVGVIGKNGSGKSTLLEILSGIKEPTSGEIEVNGKVALLAVKSFLNNEMTGRQNIYFKGKMMGMSKKMIDERLEDIIEFSEVREYIDMPLKQYSSGMKAKLGFAISINIDADILIIDEALAVGDVAFRLKCLDKMKEFKEYNKTIIYVSHSKDSIISFCDRALLLNNGILEIDGTTIQVANRYNEIVAGDATIRNIIYNKAYGFAKKSRVYTNNEPLDIVIKFKARAIDVDLNFYGLICDDKNNILIKDKLFDFSTEEVVELYEKVSLDISSLSPGLYKVYFQAHDKYGTLTIPVLNYKEFNIVAEE